MHAAAADADASPAPPPSLPIPHESQTALITSGGDMLKEASSLIVVGEFNVTGRGKTITLGHIMLNEAKKMVRAPTLSRITVSATRLTPRVRYGRSRMATRC